MVRQLNPLNLADRCNFKITKFHFELNKHKGICECGLECIASYDNLQKGTFCRNRECTYYQAGKKLINEEIKMILEEEGHDVIEITNSGTKAEIRYKCICGEEQTAKWGVIYRGSILKEKFCKNSSCGDYQKRFKNYNTDIVRSMIEKERYTLPEGFIYTGKNKQYFKDYIRLTCPNNHIFICCMDMWRQGSRCKLCNGNGRTLSLQEIKNYYKKHNCEALITEDEFKGNCTKNIIPYKCSEDHEIKNLTKNDFNNRINQNLDPCAECSRTKNNNERKDLIKKRLEALGFKLVSLNGRRICYICKCSRERYTYDSNITDDMKGCLKCVNRKEFILPKTGRKLNIQGYEDMAIKDILENKNNDISFKENTLEEDILTEDDVPTFKFKDKDGKFRIYYPDIYLKDTKFIYEVKSTYTLNVKAYKNLLKFMSVSENGYELKVLIYDHTKLDDVWLFSPGKYPVSIKKNINIVEYCINHNEK